VVERAGVEAKLGFKAYPHMLRHACGYALANKGHDATDMAIVLRLSLMLEGAECLTEETIPLVLAA
jgi:hypothetical protein